MSSTVTSATFLDGLRDAANEAVWRRFRQRYEPMLLAFVRVAGFREQDAHDVVQETLVAFLEGFRAGKYDRDKGRLQGWLRDRAAEHLGVPRNVVYLSKSRVLSRLRRLQREITEIW